MSAMTPAALAAAEEIIAIRFIPGVGVPLQDIAAIIDRHTAPKPVTTNTRYFSDGVEIWVWDGAKMRRKGHRFPSIFVSPEDLMSAVNAYETDESGKRLPAIPCDICGGSGITPGWVPSYGNPDNEGCDQPAEPCACGNWEINQKNKS